VKYTHEEFNRKTFDSFCKKVLRNEARNHFDEMNRRNDHEKSLSDLSRLEMDMLSSSDEYPSEYDFCVLGRKISIDSKLIAKAMASLSKEKRDIILLYYFFDLNDREIGKLLELIQRTVHYKRTSGLRELKKILEGKMRWESENL
jgi:RNA polymerase sigma factor (sigma-70 family)